MKPTESQIEDILRRAPRPVAPAGLKDKLTGQINLPTKATAAPNSTSPLRPLSWWQRWWPALAPACASVACAMVIVVQENEISALKDTIQKLNALINAATNSAPAKIESAPKESPVPSAISEVDEIARLKQRLAALTTEIGQLESVKMANENLRTQLATPAGLSQQELDALAGAKARAQAVACINNLKQIGLAVHLYANDNNGVTPPDFLTMSNELNTPKILFCPGNTNQSPVKTWAEFAATTSSYEFLVAGVSNGLLEPTRILTRCPLHYIVGLCDGSVQKLSRERYAERIVERDGKLYLEINARNSKP